jgi:predicted AlkP superfamily pyrophosphatase or phosphodiesterase
MASLRIITICFFLFFSKNIQAQVNTELNNGVSRPKLVIGIVIDQMRWDYLYRYYNRYGTGGFKRLMSKGFSFENNMIPYAPTVTAAGHASIYTGSVPAMHGIVGNDWEERTTGKNMYCVQDKTVQTIGSPSVAGVMSPRNMVASTIGDELRLATNFKSRVFGISLKDRGAILPAGHSANAAYWYDDSTGNWITSSYYMNALPTWVNDFNAEKRSDAFMKTTWNLLYDKSKYDQSTADDKPFEIPLKNETTVTFPHTFSTISGANFSMLRVSPYGSTFSLDFAKKLIEKEQLGKAGQTDMLCVSLSSTDYIGHRFGPQSIEIEDTYLRLDKDIENFLLMLDKTYGQNEYIVFLSADHGAAYTPNYIKEIKQPAGNLQRTPLKTALNKALEAKYSMPNIVSTIGEYQVILNHKLLDSTKLNSSEIEETIIQTMLKMPEVAYAFSNKSFEKVILPKEVKQYFENGYYASRSCDVQYILKPQYTDGNGKGTDHGTWNPYDAHIPMLWFGKGISNGKSFRETSMIDIAPTLAAMLRIQMPNACIGKVMVEVVK